MVLLALFESLSWLSSKDRRLSTSEKLPGGQADHHVLSRHFIDRREGIRIYLKKVLLLHDLLSTSWVILLISTIQIHVYMWRTTSRKQIKCNQQSNAKFTIYNTLFMFSAQIMWMEEYSWFTDWSFTAESIMSIPRDGGPSGGGCSRIVQGHNSLQLFTLIDGSAG